MNVTLTAEDFMMWNVESNLKLLQPFLDLIFEVCHIVFGLWPQCRHMEFDIGKNNCYGFYLYLHTIYGDLYF